MVNLSNLRKSKQTQQKTTGLDSAGVLSLSGTGAVVYETLDSLPATNLTGGSKAIVNDVNRLYVSDGNGWYNTDFNISYSPLWVTEPNATYEITDSVTSLVITALATDSDTPNLINTSAISDSGQYLVDVTIDSSIFTFIPKSQDSIGQSVTSGNLIDSNQNTFTYTFRFSDGVNIVQKVAAISYNFAIPIVLSGITGIRDWTTRIDSDLAEVRSSYLWDSKTVYVGDNKFITTWIDDNYYLWARGGKIDGNTVTLGNPIKVQPVGNYGSGVVTTAYHDLATARDGFSAVVAYQDRSNYYSYSTGTYEEDQERWGYVKRLYFSGGLGSSSVQLISNSRQQVSPTPTSGQPNQCSKIWICHAGNGNFIVQTTRFTGMGQHYMADAAVQHSGSTGLTVTRSATAFSGFAWNWGAMGFSPDLGKVLSIQTTNNGGQNMHAMIYTVNQSTGVVSRGGSYQFDMSGGNTTSMRDYSLHWDDNANVMCYVYKRNGLRMIPFNISGSAPSPGTDFVILPSNEDGGGSDQRSPPYSYYNRILGTSMLQCRLSADSAAAAILPVTVNSSTSITFDSDQRFMIDQTGDNYTGNIKIDWDDSDLSGTAMKISNAIYVGKYTDFYNTPDVGPREWYLRIMTSAYNTGFSGYVQRYVDVTSNHPDWSDDSGMTTSITLQKILYYPSNTLYTLGDTLSSSDFTLTSNSLYHTWGLNNPSVSALHAPNGYPISGFTKDQQGYRRYWNIDFGDRSGDDEVANAISVIDQLFEDQNITGYGTDGSTPWIRLIDANGYYYDFSNNIGLDGSGWNDDFSISATSQIYSSTGDPRATTPSTPSTPTFAWGGDRGVLGGGWYELNQNMTRTRTIQYYDMTTTNNATSFGLLSVSRSDLAGTSSTSRGVFFGGDEVSNNFANTMEYITIATTGNTTDFGNLTEARNRLGATGNGTRGLAFGGKLDATNTSWSTTIDYVTIATTSDATDFGDHAYDISSACGVSDATRAVMSSGYTYNSWPSGVDEMQYVTIDTTGNSTTFGDQTLSRWSQAGASDTTRGIFAGGVRPGTTYTKVIDYITIQTTGNATSFGDLAGVARDRQTGNSNGTVATIAGGYDQDIYPSTDIDRVTIQTTGNASSPQDLAVGVYAAGGFAGNAS